MRTVTVATLFTVGLAGSLAAAEVPPAELQIAAAVTAASEGQRESATVLGYTAELELVTLRRGDGDLICLGDDPRDERFHVACYHRDLEPFMVRGRQLRAEGLERPEVQRIRREEIEAGSLAMPERPTALSSLTGPADSFDPVTGEVRGAGATYVVYMPYATEASTGMTTRPTVAGVPWLMAPGEPWAHVMITPPMMADDTEAP